MDGEIVDFYENLYDESVRLDVGVGLLEKLRTQSIIARYLADQPQSIADVGGGAGVYAGWLAKLGHRVSLIDPTPRHVATASQLDPSPGTISAGVGDARQLDFPDESFDLVLQLGPLYHLPERSDRNLALAEGTRVLRPGGRLIAAGISRFASTHDGLVRGWYTDEGFRTRAARTREDGVHHNPERHPNWFTTAYFHKPDELGDELKAAGFEDIDVLGVEGLAGWLPDLDERLSQSTTRDSLLSTLASVEREPSLVGVSAHLLAIGRKP